MASTREAASATCWRASLFLIIERPELNGERRMHELERVRHPMMDLSNQQVLVAQQALVLEQQRLLVAQHLRLGVLALLGTDRDA